MEFVNDVLCKKAGRISGLYSGLDPGGEGINLVRTLQRAEIKTSGRSRI